jgi:hypothetical protein
MNISNMEVPTNPERLKNDAGSCSVLWQTGTIGWSTLAMQPVPTWGTSRVPTMLSMSSHRYKIVLHRL